MRLNGESHNACVVPTEFGDTRETNLDNLTAGIRGNLIPGRINYFFAANAGQNFFNYLPFQTSRHVVASVQDASLTFSYIPGARVRVGLFKKPGPEETELIGEYDLPGGQGRTSTASRLTDTTSRVTAPVRDQRRWYRE